MGKDRSFALVFYMAKRERKVFLVPRLPRPFLLIRIIESRVDALRKLITNPQKTVRSLTQGDSPRSSTPHAPVDNFE